MRLALALCALALLGSACSDPKKDEAAGVRHVVYWEKWTDFEGEAMGRVVDRFNSAQRARAESEPGYRPIEVEMVVISRIETKLLVASAGGNPPDVAGFYTARVPAYADKGALVDLTDLAQKDGLDRGKYVEHYYDLSVHRGRLWGLPTTPASVALHWNKRLFREAGLDPEKPPETLEQLDEMAEKLTKWEITLPNGSKEVRTGYLPGVPAAQKRLLQLGFFPGEPDWWSYGWGFVFGGQLLEGDKITTASPENLRAYRWVASYSKKVGVDAIKRFRSGFGDFGTAENPFLSSRLAMQVQGVWMYNFIKKFADGMPWGAAPFPAPSDRPELRGVANAEADNLVIPAASRHPEEAWEFIKYVQSQPVMEELCLGQRKHSPLQQVSDEFWAKHPNPHIRLFAELGSLPHAWAAPKTGVWNEYNRELNTVANRIQSLDVTPEEGLLQVQTTMQRSLDRELLVFSQEVPVSPLERRKLGVGLLFSSPWLIGLSVFLLFPLLSALYYSLCDYSVLLPPVFVGFDNYIELVHDRLFWKSLWNTTFYALGSVTLSVVVALTLAILLNSKVKGLAFYRTVFFLPSLMPLVATCMLWSFMYKGEGGLINSLLEQIGVTGPAWFADPNWSKPALVFMAAWGAGNAMVIFLAGLQDVPTSLYEASIIDGAGWLQRLIHVTLPMISPVIYFNVVMGIIGAFQAFAQALIMTDRTSVPGSPEQSTLFYVLQLYNVGFQDLRMGYASAMAWVLFLIILALTYLATQLSKRWVTYDR